MTVQGTILGVALLLGGAWSDGEVAFRPSPQESSVPELFRLKPEAFRYELEPVFSTGRYTVSRLRFPSPINTGNADNDTVHAEYFEPRDGAKGRPAVVVLHILGSDFPLSRYLAARLADRGISALFLKLPYYGERRPRAGPGPVPTKFLSADLERTMTSMRQGICDVRRGLRWLASRPGNDPSRLGVVGISLGGIVGSVVVAVDPSASRGAFLLAGGDLSKILWDMPETARFRQSWEAAGKSILDLKALTDPYDPLTYASRLKGKQVLMIAGNIDEVVPPASAEALWVAAGRPPIIWYDCGHYSAVGYLLPGIRKAVDFLAAPGPP
ncbi:alpha/beta hydrolase [Aquisphaera insulae]|uniref:alpha/beta hydrolase n=1 Tax=Aquisphaera insulae TaxID=2712864 RepID=UPI0013EE265C|nr:alpha/beta hydrolase family protein [Aquisphaera insulae]